MNHGHQNNHGIFPVFDDMDEFTHFDVGEGNKPRYGNYYFK